MYGAQSEQKKEKVLITGGAGFLGINLVRFLLQRNYDVVSLDLVPFDYDDVKDKINIVDGDIRDKQIVDVAMKGVDYVVHTAAALPLYKPEEIYSTDIEGTKNILDSAFKHKVKRMVHVSSTAVYGIPDHHPLFETDKLHGVGPYGEAKVKAEAICEEYREKGMCIPIIRPKSFVGPERLGVFALLYDWAQDGKNFPILGNGENKYQLLDVEDLCDAIFLTITKPVDVANKTYNIGAKEFTTMRKDFQAVLDEAGYGKKIKGFPAEPAMWFLRFLEMLHVSPLYKWVYETAATDSFVSIEKAEKELGYTPKFSNKDALIRNYRWYLKNLHRFEGKSGVTHRVPWKQGAVGMLKIFF